jgi:parallel beta-helix repeat protein
MKKWLVEGAVLVCMILIITGTCMVVRPVRATGRDIFVPDDYATIQAAVDAAEDGARIYVRNGVYPENVVVNKTVMLIGENWDETKIVGNWTQNYLRPITINHDGVKVEGFGLVDSYAGVTIGQVGNCTITGNKFLNNKYGIMITTSSGNTITGNIIESAKEGAYAIELTRASNNLISGNQITSAAIGISVTDSLISQTDVITSQNNTITTNHISNCNDKAVRFMFTKENLLSANSITNCTVGLALMWTDDNVVYGNNFVDNALQVAGGPEPMFSGGNEIRYSICQWDNGTTGNYWSNYTGTDANGDGIGDPPCVLNEANSAHPPPRPPPAHTEFKAEKSQVPPNPTPPTQTATPTPPNPFPTGQAIAILASVTVAAAGLFLYFRKPNANKKVKT